jgi:hypothetical protein
VRHDRLVVRDDDDRLAGVDESLEQAERRWRCRPAAESLAETSNALRVHCIYY